VLGIIGGVGPKATARLYLSLTSRFSAQAGRDLPELLVHSVAMTRRIEDAFLGGHVNPRSPELAAVRALLGDAVARLARGGAELVVMPCNTLQHELAELCAARGIEHLDMLDATVEAVAAAGVHEVMVLGTTTTCRADLYGQRLRLRGIGCRYPDAGEQARVETHIRSALDLRPGPRSSLAELVHEHTRACDGILLACTDLSIDMGAEADELPVFDSLECLAAAATRRIVQIVQPVARRERQEWRGHGR
jgi:aspartate racemase